MTKKRKRSINKKKKIHATKSDGVEEEHTSDDKDTEEETTGGVSTATSAVSNPLLQEQQAFLNRLSPAERDSFFSNDVVEPSRRAEIWMEQADIGESLVNKYSWATPDSRALRVLKHFSPIIEIGCGSRAYWCSLMQNNAGIDVVGYDIEPDEGGTIQHHHTQQQQQQQQQQKSKHKKKKNQKKQFHVRKGGPEALRHPENRNRTLFLCYPDEDDYSNIEDATSSSPPTSLGSVCLENYSGDYVIHVGELFVADTATLAIDQAPWGRSTSPEFQQQLAAQFHCLLRISLPGWLHVRDSLTVWKRSETCSIVFAADSDDDDDDEDEEVEYRHIPVEERLPTDIAAPCLAHLLTTNNKGIASTSDDNDDDDDDDNDGRGERSNIHTTSRSSKKKKKKKTSSADITTAPAAPQDNINSSTFAQQDDGDDDDQDGQQSAPASNKGQSEYETPW